MKRPERDRCDSGVVFMCRVLGLLLSLRHASAALNPLSSTPLCPRLAGHCSVQLASTLACACTSTQAQWSAACACGASSLFWSVSIAKGLPCLQAGGEVDGPKNIGIAQKQQHLSKDASV